MDTWVKLAAWGAVFILLFWVVLQVVSAVLSFISWMIGIVLTLLIVAIVLFLAYYLLSRVFLGGSSHQQQTSNERDRIFE